MARFEFRLPDIGEGIAEAEIVKWHVKAGDVVKADEPLVDVMTDKATIAIESPVSGTIAELFGEEGKMLAIGSSLAIFETTDGAADRTQDQAAPVQQNSPPPQQEPQPKPEPEPEPEQVSPPQPAPESDTAAEKEPAAAPASDAPKLQSPAKTETDERPLAAPLAWGLPPGKTTGKALASPAVRARARKLGIDLAEVVPATGERIRHSDLDAFIAYNAAGGFAPVGRTGQDEQVRVIGLRRRTAEAMAASKQHIPHFAYVEECDVTALEEARRQLNEGAKERGHLTVLPFVIIAICRALPDYPGLNARYDDEAGVIDRSGAVHMGLATQTEAGLVVPVIRNAETLNLWQLANEITRLANAARDFSLNPQEMAGSTITITSLGRLGGIASTPVINRPEVAIIAPNRIIERPMFIPSESGGERISKRRLMNLSISCDHRVVDGWDAANFVSLVKHFMENPALLLAG